MLDSRRLSQDELSELWGISTSQLETWRSNKKGPPFIKLGPKIVRYRLSDILEFEEKNFVETNKK